MAKQKQVTYRALQRFRVEKIVNGKVADTRRVEAESREEALKIAKTAMSPGR